MAALGWLLNLGFAGGTATVVGTLTVPRSNQITVHNGGNVITVNASGNVITVR